MNDCSIIFLAQYERQCSCSFHNCLVCSIPFSVLIVWTVQTTNHMVGYLAALDTRKYLVNTENTITNKEVFYYYIVLFDNFWRFSYEVFKNPYADVALLSLKDIWQNTPPNWVGSDPCGKGWEGIGCKSSRVTSMYAFCMVFAF